MRKSLTKNQIIRFQTDIDSLFKAGKRYTSSCFKLLLRQNNLSYSRLIVIPVKHYGNSIQRNTIRRQIKEIWRTHQESIIPGIDCAFIVYPAANLKFQQLEKSILEILEKSSSLKG